MDDMKDISISHNFIYIINTRGGRKPYQKAKAIEMLEGYEALSRRVAELEAELKKWKDHYCGSQYREVGTTGMLTDQMGNLYERKR